jgi:nucleotide-binding universal stress UspA family protein
VLNKDKTFQWWNPLAWVDAILQVIGAIFRSICEFLGLLSPPPTDRHENIQVADVDAAEKDAREAQTAVDEIVADMTPAQIVHAYCRATEEVRKTMDLAKLSIDQQDWLMRLSDADLVMLGESGEAACGRSVMARKVMVSRSKLRIPEMETAPQVLATPEPMSEDEKREFMLELMKDRHSELFLASGAANTNPKFVPRSGATLH